MRGWTLSSYLEFPVCIMTVDEVRKAKVPKKEYKEMTLEEYYQIEDSVCQLTRLRSYQLSDIFGKYKLF